MDDALVDLLIFPVPSSSFCSCITHLRTPIDYIYTVVTPWFFPYSVFWQGLGAAQQL
jgi:hypothetical protein